MPFQQTRFVGPTTLTTSPSTALYTVPAQYTGIIKQLVVTNTTASTRTFSFYIGSVALESTALFRATSVLANDSIVINLSQVINAGDKLFALADAGSALNLTVSGVLNDGPLEPTDTYIPDNAVTTTKIADGSVTSSKIAAGAIVTSYIADNAVTQSKLATTVPLGGMRNAIINGDFRINQRGFSATTTNLEYGHDRWRFVAVDGTVVYSNQTFSPGNAIPDQEPTNFVRIQTIGQSAATAEAGIWQPIEDVRTFAGRQVTVSFWAKASFGTPKIAIEWEQIFGTGGSGTTQTYGVQVTLSTSWTRYSVTSTVASVSGKTIGTGSNVRMKLYVSAGSNLNARTGSIGVQNATFDIWGVQAELGPQSTAFEQRPIGVELALCQRYFCTNFPFNAAPSNGQSIYNADLPFFHAYATNQIRTSWIRFPVTMRAEPNLITFYRTDFTGVDGRWGIYQGAWNSTGAMTATEANSHGFQIDTTATATLGLSYLATGYWTASAEL